MSEKSESRTRAGSARRGGGGGGVTADEMDERLAATEEAMLRLAKDRDAAREMMPLFGVAFSTAMAWCLTVRERWKTEAADRKGVDRETLIREHVERFGHLYKFARGRGETRAAIAAAERMAQIDGLLGAKVEITGKDGGPLELRGLPDAQLQEIIRRGREDG